MNQILIPLNPRSDYENILNYAESVAQKSGARLVLLYAGGRRAIKGQDQTYHSHHPIGDFIDSIRKKRVQAHIRSICQRLLARSVNFTIQLVNRSGSGEIIDADQQADHDLILMGTHSRPGFRGIFEGSLASRVIGAVKTPVFVVPGRNRYNEIRHITYAVDLTDYDPSIIQQVKSIATLFDAKLTIAHVNSGANDKVNKENYLNSLERTISDTLDYPKINYRFFDHADPLAGLKKLINLEDSQMVAMTNRNTRYRWFSRSLTRKMARELTVPVLAFRKHER
jgi:nucleotide-binding universal stress UspA family protein